MASQTPLKSTMMDFPLTLQMVFAHGRKVHGITGEVVTWTGAEARRATFAKVAERIQQLAGALTRLGVGPGDRVGTLMWNNQEHLEAYFAVPCMGAVLHTLNLRLFPDQLAYVINHAGDKVIIVDDSLAPLLARVASELETVEHVIVTGAASAAGLDVRGAEMHGYEAGLAAEVPTFAWPEIDERSAAAMCYTTGTTGAPKGVAYSHRSIVLHTLGVASSSVVPLTEKDKALLIVPQFHAMAWGLPYACWAGGIDMLMPERYLQPEPLARMIESEKPTYAAAVPTIWNGLLLHSEQKAVDLSSLRLVTCGGAAVPKALIQRFKDKHGVAIVQGWGMTETSPVAAISWPPRGTPDAEAVDWYARTGRVIFGVELRLVDEAGAELPWDGQSIGEFEVRGPWITGAYFKEDTPDKFHDGWLRTGDVGTVDPRGFLQITDRAKDVIKSGGEWISSVELENVLMGHPDIAEAAVIGVPDQKWDERPLACVVLKPGIDRDPAAIRSFLTDKVARWWLPERYAFVDEVPKTSVGKFDKKVLRTRYAKGDLDVRESGTGEQ
jgi:acyl-CoA synthetase (AMP-forming)/AMP-acid ligase II